MIYVLIFLACILIILFFTVKNLGYQKAKKESEYQQSLKEKIFLSNLRDRDKKIYESWDKNRTESNSSKKNEENNDDELGIGSFL